MQILSLIYPMATLVLLTALMISFMLVLRVKAVRTRKVSPRYFKLNEGGNVPAQLTAVTQNYNNLLELPILFYAVCILAIILNQSTDYFIYHAWAFVVLRVIHSYIHITYNHIVHRLLVFSASCLVLISMWVKVVLLVS